MSKKINNKLQQLRRSLPESYRNLLIKYRDGLTREEVADFSRISKEIDETLIEGYENSITIYDDLETRKAYMVEWVQQQDFIEKLRNIVKEEALLNRAVNEPIESLEAVENIACIVYYLGYRDIDELLGGLELIQNINTTLN